MNKKELVKYVSDKTLITESDASIIIDVVFDGVKKGLGKGERVKIRDFGSFFVKKMKARISVNPKDQTPIDVPEKNMVKFKVSDKLHQIVNKNI